MPKETTFRQFCADQVQRFSIFRRFDFLETTGQKELRNWLERRGQDSPTIRQQIAQTIDAATGLSELPTLADLNRIWNELNPPIATVSADCQHCGGTGFEIIQRGGYEGAKRCRCGGVPLADQNATYQAPVGVVA
ncbi:MAG: hypothetical protein JWN34_3776 [Bryobacterales bacterium]|nr:hypothetical protein [Bryobacterales bacterium]